MLSRLLCILCFALLVLSGCDDTSPTVTENGCQSSPCLNDSTCVADGETVTCECAEGFSGEFCETAETAGCDPNPCQNGGTCSVGDDGTETCACAEGYTGDSCEIAPPADPCDPNPCKNEGTCAADDNGDVSCTCTEGFEGDFCEAVADPCFPNPCQNEGSCKANDDGSVTCTCADGFEGDLCENENVPTPCEFHCEGIVAAGCDNPDLPNVGACVAVCGQLTADPSCGALFEEVVGCMDDSNDWTCTPADADGETSFVPAKEGCVESFGKWVQCTQMADPCNAFCDAATETCTEDNAMDFGDTGCFNTCIGWAPGTEGDTEGDTLACRNYHLAVAAEDSPEVHCPHAGPDGGGVCDPPTWCELVCAETIQCDEEPDLDVCLTGCEDALAGPCADAFVGLQACPESTGEWVCDEEGGVNTPANDACAAEMAAVIECYDALDPCYGEPCANGGECTTEDDETFSCECAEGYMGDTCEEMNPCEPNPCANEGSCSLDDNAAAQCECAGGWEGATCTDVVYCYVTCQAQAEACGDNSADACIASCEKHEAGPCSAEVLALQECQPPEAWVCGENGTGVPDGEACDEEWNTVLECLDPCLPNPCGKEDVCVPMENGMTSCVPTSCEENPCQNDGECYQFGDDDDAIACFCEAGFYGPLCEYVETPCEPANPCANEATCSVTEDGEDFLCECPEGFVGKTCENYAGGPCDPGPCLNGSCTEIVDACQSSVSCDDETCKSAVGKLDTWCNTNWDSSCAACAAGEVTNYADCTGIQGCKLENPSAECACDAGWEDKICATDIDECAGNFNPCQNEGICVNTDGSFECGCAEGWEGDTCGDNIDDCPEENPCQNGGVCVDGLNEFTCDCVAGTEGDLCDVNIDECTEEGICGEGTCVDELPGYSCECPDDLSGDNCEFENPCFESPCENGGTCSEFALPGGFDCDTTQNGTGCAANAACEDAVCAVDSYCCNSSWDNLCAACADGSGGIDAAGCQQASLSCALPGGLSYTCDCIDDYVGDICESCGECGDVTGDGVVNQEDSEAFIEVISDENLSTCKSWRADVNNDGELNVVDVQLLNLYLNAEEGDEVELSCPVQ